QVQVRHLGTKEVEDKTALALNQISKEAVMERMARDDCSLQAESIAEMKEVKIARTSLSIDTALFKLDEDIAIRPSIKLLTENVFVSFKGIAEPEPDMEVQKLGKATKHTSGTIAGRKYVMMPKSGQISFEFIVTSSLADDEFSAK